MKMNGCLSCGRPLSLLLSLSPTPLAENLSLRGSGEAAVPERNPSCPQRPCLALSVWGEGEERAEPRKVSGQTVFPFSSSSVFVLCFILGTFFFTFHFLATSVITLVKYPTALYTGIEVVKVYFS